MEVEFVVDLASYSADSLAIKKHFAGFDCCGDRVEAFVGFDSPEFERASFRFCFDFSTLV